jgi:hypothetical protein
VPAFPLSVDAKRRYLVDAQGRPFLIHGDAAWSIVVQLAPSEVRYYLDTRRRQGVNTILVNLLEHHFADHPPSNFLGAPPFRRRGDFSTPNEAYFSHVEFVVAEAAERGILVLMTAAYLGYEGGGEGWYPDMVTNGESKLRSYGRYIGNRFKAYPNVIWVQGGDYNPPDKAPLRAVANGIRDVDPARLQTFHGARGTSALGFLGTGEPWLTVNNIYTDEKTIVASAFLEYARATMPFFLIEARYENERGADELVVRSQAYQAVLSGAAGQLMGNDPVWRFSRGWRTALESNGAMTLAHLHSLFDSLAWWTLVPDTSNALLTAGAGADGSRAVAARAANGAFALLYTPSVRELTVDLAQLGGPGVRARWYDPTRGTHTVVAGSPFPANGSKSFTPAGNNASGFGDWVLVLESV